MNHIKHKIARSFSVQIYLAGPIDIAKQIIRRECMREGLCVTVTPTTYVYTGGEEAGYVVGLINYPRFPKEEEEILGRARQLGQILMDETFQHSYSIDTPNDTIFFSRRSVD